MNVYDAIQSRRTIRKFTQEPVKQEDLLKLVDCARLAPYGANLQPLKFMIITDRDILKNLYPLTKWAGYLDWEPAENERPSAYIAVLNDTSLKPTANTECDSGAAVMSMILEAQELGLSSAWLGALQRDEIKKLLKLDSKLDVTYLLAVGYAAQTGKPFDIEDSVKYYFDGSGNVMVPKRTLDEVLVK
ncbi:MAG: nitroreductase family protein [bacterium]|nr:nitroreductase family protein [bacterium]